MTMKELLEYKENKKKANAIAYNKARTEHGEISGLTDKEYNSIKVGQKSSTTRRTHARGAYWNFKNQPIKSDI